MGAPTTYCPKMGEAICERVAAGEFMVDICGPNRPDGWPHQRTVYVWLRTHKDFARAYEIAREAQADRIFAQMMGIADGEGLKGAGRLAVSRDKLKIATRKYVVSKLAPKRYGAKAEAPEIETPPAPKSELEVAVRLVSIMEEARWKKIQECEAAGIPDNPWRNENVWFDGQWRKALEDEGVAQPGGEDYPDRHVRLDECFDHARRGEYGHVGNPKVALVMELLKIHEGEGDDAEAVET